MYNIQETGTTNKTVLYCFVRFKRLCKMSGVILKCVKEFEREVIKTLAMIVSYERT